MEKLKILKKAQNWKKFKKKEEFLAKNGRIIKNKKLSFRAKNGKLKKKSSLRAKNGKIENIKKRMGDWLKKKFYGPKWKNFQKQKKRVFWAKNGGTI